MSNIEEIQKIYQQPLVSLIEKAHSIHKENFDPNQLQTSQLLSIKTGGCPEDCGYCPQSAHYQTGLQRESLLDVETVVNKARKAQLSGATRFCMGAAWREVKDGPQFDQVLEMVRAVCGLNMEVCCTLGMVTEQQALRLKEAGLFAYNHNIDTSKEHYSQIISTREYSDRLRTLENVRSAGITVCTGGILGLGESDEDRIGFLHTLVSLDPQPESVTVNTLVRIPGTPMADVEPIDPSIIVRVIATARILIPKAMIRLSAGRSERTSLEQFLCFYAGANSIFFGEQLLTSPNPSESADLKMLKSFGMQVSALRG